MPAYVQCFITHSAQLLTWSGCCHHRVPWGKYQIRQINYTYCFTQHEATLVHHGALVDSRANGGMACSDTRVLSVTPQAFVDITGVGGEMLTEFRQTLQVQSHLEMPGILVQLGHIQRT